MLKWCIVALALLTCLRADPIAASENVLRGKFAFNWFADPNKTPCVRIGSKLMTMLTSARFHCVANPRRDTASGVPASICSSVDGKSEYMIFGTLAACETERKTQAANGD